VLIYFEDACLPAFIIEETSNWITFAKAKVPSPESDEVCIIKKAGASYTEITMSQMIQCGKQFGKGYISLIG
jgi:hypothetical protein